MEETPPPPPPPSYDNERFWSLLLHLSALTGFVSFAGFFVGPVLVWLIQRERFPGVTAHFHEAINFQISILIYSAVALGIGIATFGFGLIVAVPLLVVFGLMGLVLPILAAIKASEGRPFRYPMTMRFVR